MQADVQEVESIENPGGYAYVIGSAVYQFHWLKEAREFASKNRAVLANRPVWIFSSGPTGAKSTDSKGRDLREVSGPKELDELQEWMHPRGHRVFFGAFYRDRVTGTAGWIARFIPTEEEGDFRDWRDIEFWTASISNALVPATV